MGQHTVFVSVAGFKSMKQLPVVLARLVDAGVRRIELSGGLDYFDGDLIGLLKRWSNSAHVEFVVHNYFPAPSTPFLLNIAAIDNDLWRRSIEFCQNSLHLAAEIEAPVYGVHAGYIGNLKDRGDGYFFPQEDITAKLWQPELEAAYHKLIEAVAHLAPLAGKLGVKLCVENLFPMTGMPPQLMTGLRNWQRFFADTQGLNVGLLLDLAHLKIAQTLGGEDFDTAIKWALTAGRQHIDHIHVSHTDGDWDSHARLTPDSWVWDCLEQWAVDPGWPVVPVSYESRDLDINHIVEMLPAISAAMSLQNQPRALADNKL